MVARNLSLACIYSLFMKLLCTSVSWPGTLHNTVSQLGIHWEDMYTQIVLQMGIYLGRAAKCCLQFGLLWQSCQALLQLLHFWLILFRFILWNAGNFALPSWKLAPCGTCPFYLLQQHPLLKKLQVRDSIDWVITAWLYFWAYFTLSHFSFLLLTSQCSPTFSYSQYYVVAALVLPWDRWWLL